METVVTTIRSALISTKGKCDLRTLQKDYHMLMGTSIPFQQFGYKKLEDFLRNCPTLSVSNGPNGQTLVDAIPTEQSSHISSLVNRQKPSKKKPKISLRRGPSYGRPRHSTQTNWKPASTGKKWQPSYQASSRPAAVAHNQIVHWSNSTKQQDRNTNNNYSNHNNQTKPKIERQFSAPRLERKSSANVIFSPRTRAAVYRNYSEDYDTERVVKNSTPPLQVQEKPDVEKSFTSRIRRTFSQPSNGAAALQQTLAESETRLKSVDLGSARPRMRTVRSLNSPTFAVPTASTPVQCAAPVLPQHQIDELTKNALAAVDPNSSVWSWPSSDESTPRGANSIDGIVDKLAWTSENSPNRLFMDCASPRSSILMELKVFVNNHNLGEPSIKIAERRVKGAGRKVLYDCKIKIGNHTYSSYPEDYFTREAAQMAAASLALNDLKLKYGKIEHYLLATEKDILERIPPIIEKHFHGVWATQIELDYEDTFGEQLPPNWLTLLDTLPTISVEHTIENKYVLRHCKIGEKNKGNFNEPLASEVSVPSNTVRVTEDGTVVQVTCALSTVEVWCRELYTSEAEDYNTMLIEMENYYAQNAQHPIKINKGGFYAAFFDDMWCRVRALLVVENDVMCFFIDFGDEYLIPKSQIYVLHRQFARQQAQAFVCRLGGLEELVNICSPLHLEQITGKEYFATAFENTPSSDNQIDLDSVLTIVLYDTVSDCDTNINQELMKIITIESSISSLEKDVINKVFVSHADQLGNVYVQPCSEGYDKFMDLMSELEDIIFDSEVPNAAMNPEKLALSDRLYLTKWSTDNRYYRCTICDISPDKAYAQIVFVDYGNEEIIKLKKAQLFPLNLISDVLVFFPPQAIKVKINIDPNTLPDNFATKLQELLPNDQVTLLKILRTEDGVHYCDFFKRSAENVLFSVNSSLELENEIPEHNVEDGNNNDRSTNLQKKLERLRTINMLEDLTKKPVPSTGLLKAPNLPPVDGYFEVKVPCAVSPWNFFVQPYETGKKLKELMNELQEKYKVVTHSPIQIEDVVPGRIYASKHEDGFWYRTSVIKVIHTGSISVFYCDFGYYANLKIYQLVPLDGKLMELPFQAIKAKINGIKPKLNKWSMDDCKYFEQLVSRHTFASYIRDIQKDELYKYDIVLSLELIDTSSDTDISLGQLLIDKEIAVADNFKK